MSNLFKRSGSVPQTRRSRPVLESLEQRDCPSFLVTQPDQQLWYLLNTAPTSGAIRIKPATVVGQGGVSGPTITSVNLVYNGKTSITITGTVTDPSASVSNLLVTFGGQAPGTTYTDTNGNFGFTTNALGPGLVTITTTDSLGYVAPVANVNLNPAAPVVSNFGAVEGADQLFTFSGNVTDLPPGGLTVNFGGIPDMVGQSTTVNSNGTFEFTIRLNDDGSDNGTVTAQTTDWWGLLSNQASTSVVVSV
jgi:hypothetical protein